MSEGTSSGAASTGAATGQAGQQSAGQQIQTAQAQAGGEGGQQTAGTGGESVQASFEKAATQTISEDDYTPVKDYIRKQYQDEQFDDDDQVDRKAYKHIKDLEKYRTDNREANKKVMTLFNAHPELVDALRDMDEGADFAEAIALNLDPEQRKVLREVVLADDYVPQKENWKQKKTEREAKFAEKQKWTESYSENRKISANNLKEFATENSLDQTAMEGVAKYADQVLADVYNGKVSKQFLAMIHKAMNADAEIAKAAQVAEVKGRNAASVGKAEKADPVGDGLPDLAKGGETKQAPKRSEGENMVFGLVDGFKKKTEKFT